MFLWFTRARLFARARPSPSASPSLLLPEPELGTAPTSTGTLRVPLLNAFLEPVAEVAAEFIVVRPLVPAGLANSNVQMYWKMTTAVRVLTHRRTTRVRVTTDGAPKSRITFGPSLRQITESASSATQKKESRGGLLVTGSSLAHEYTILPVQVRGRTRAERPRAGAPCA